MTSNTPKTAKSKVTRTRKAAASRASGLVTSARDLAGQVETMPKSQQRMLTRTSLGVGAALFILGAPRLLTLLAFLPAAAVAGMRLVRRAA